jgi:hypothetical protein
MRKRKLYPEHRLDRAILLIGGTAIVFFSVAMFGAHHAWRLPLMRIVVILLVVIGGLVAFWAFVYLIQTPPRDRAEDYAVIITNIEDIGNKLVDLNVFLKRERDRVEVSEATLRRLRDEKTELEPMVTAQRETVNAILAAHAKATASRVWKERFLAFMTGILTSLLATLLFELLKH